MLLLFVHSLYVFWRDYRIVHQCQLEISCPAEPTFDVAELFEIYWAEGKFFEASLSVLLLMVTAISFGQKNIL